MLPHLEASLAFLETFCVKNNVDFWIKKAGAKRDNIYLIGSNDKVKGSAGVAKSGKVKFFFKDLARERWAILEGFSEEQIESDLANEIIKEVSLQEFASLLVGVSSKLKQ